MATTAPTRYRSLVRRALRPLLLPALALASSVAGCSSDLGPAPPPPPPCELGCQDGIALRGMREGMKLVFNLTLQGKPVGAHDYTVPCPLGGLARIYGTATANAEQGATEVDLTYDINGCTLLERDDDVEENYELTVTGVVRQVGTLAVQPTSSTALSVTSDDLTVVGNVYEPPVPYEVRSCPVRLSQDGNRLAGYLCDRIAAVDL